MSCSATVTVADLLELRADGLTEEEIWSLLCQAVQTLQDLFLSEEITDGKALPVVTPNTLGISNKGKVVVFLVNRIHSYYEPYLAPEFADQERRNTNSLDWEKMWVYSLGRTLLFAVKATPQTKSSTVLRSMTAKDPTLRASLMLLLNIISEHCTANLPFKPFSHLVMGMFKEVFGSPSVCLLPLETPDSNNAGTERVASTESCAPRRHSLDVGKKTHSKPASVDGSSEPGKSRRLIKKNPVQRAPSRLYRGPSAPACSRSLRSGDRLLPSGCIGPEFVVRGMEPLKVVHVGDVKTSHRRSLTVILLTGQRILMTCDPRSITCSQLFEILVHLENIEDNYLFGLASLINGDFVFIPSVIKLHKVAPSGWKDGGKEPSPCNFLLYIRVKFFLPSLREFKNSKTKHLMYLQLRRSLLEQQIKCELQELLTLGGLALQAEFGNFHAEEHGASSYFLLEHYLPEELIDEKSGLERMLQEHHRSRYGLDPVLAEEIFVAQVQRLPEYGSHHYTAVWVRKSVSIPMWVTVNPQGVYLYEKKKNVLDRKIHEAFVWKNIQGLSFSENYFRLAPRDVFGQKMNCYKLRLDNKKSFFLFQLASFHHQFFLKLRIELSPLNALSQDFGIISKEDTKTAFYVEEGSWRDEGDQKPETFHLKNRKKAAAAAFDKNIEERQNKENENPLANKREKRVGVKMGVSAFYLSNPGTPDASERLTFFEASSNSLDAYVIDASIRSSDEKFAYDLQESIPSKLVSEWDDVSWEEERILKRVHLCKDKYGSFGLEIVEGNNGGLFVENVLKRKGDDEISLLHKGDQLVSVNRVCLLNLNYSEALNVLRTAGTDIEVLVSQSCNREVLKKPLERDYLKNVQLEVAGEAESLESEVTFISGLR